MISPLHTKIAIIGCAGSGKTYVALQLSKKLHLPLYHLDQYYWKPGWQRTSTDDFTLIHEHLCNQDAWIIEGSYMRFLENRLQKADIIIFLDVPRYLCLWRVIKRSIMNLGKVIPGNPQNCKQQLFTRKFLEFLQWVWNFNARYRKQTVELIETHKNNKQIYILRSPKDVAAFLASIMHTL